MAMNFKRGDKVYIYKPTSSWEDTKHGIDIKEIKLNTPYIIDDIYYHDERGMTATLLINKHFHSWHVGIDCLKHYNKTSKPTWL